MDMHDTGCLICGKPLQYSTSPKMLRCTYCGKEFPSTACCEDGHFVCDACHAQQGYQAIRAVALKTTSKNPSSIALEMMQQDYVNMHGPEHHFLIVAALLAAYKNAGGDLNLEQSLAMALTQAKQVPGGICGFWGSCGAGIGAGMFISIISGATPLSKESWKLSNMATAGALSVIAEHGGPRCCKRDVLLSISSVVPFTAEHFGINMDAGPLPACIFFRKNGECLAKGCPFFPVPAKKNGDLK